MTTLLRLISHIINHKIDLCYIAITSTGLAFFRDVIYISVLKLFNVKLVYHMHNKGVNSFQNNFFYHLCYKFIFRDVKVILLSKLLYSDIQKYVGINNFYICPNGIDNIKLGFQRQSNAIPKLLFLSNLMRSKGVYDLLDACFQLKKKGVDFYCDYVGAEADITKEDIDNKINTPPSAGVPSFGK